MEQEGLQLQGVQEGFQLEAVIAWATQIVVDRYTNDNGSERIFHQRETGLHTDVQLLSALVTSSNLIGYFVAYQVRNNLNPIYHAFRLIGTRDWSLEKKSQVFDAACDHLNGTGQMPMITNFPGRSTSY